MSLSRLNILLLSLATLAGFAPRQCQASPCQAEFVSNGRIYPLISLLKDKETWVNLRQVADFLDIRSKVNGDSMRFTLSAGELVLRRGSYQAQCPNTAFPALEKAPVKDGPYLWLPATDLPNLFDVSVQADPSGNCWKIQPQAAVKGLESHSVPLTTEGRRAMLLAEREAAAEDPDLGVEDLYPKAFELDGNWSTQASSDTSGLGQADQAQFFASGHAGDLPLELYASPVFSGGRTALQDGRATFGGVSSRLRLGDTQEYMDGFRSVLESRRGVEWSSSSEGNLWLAHYSPASIQLGDRAQHGLEGAKLTRSFGGQTTLSATFDHLDYPGSVIVPAGSNDGTLGFSFGLPAKATLSGAVAESFAPGIENGQAFRAELDSSGTVRMRAFFEKASDTFLSLGNSRLYAGSESGEIHSVLRLGRWQPYLDVWRRFRDNDLAGQSGLHSVGTAGLRVGIPNGWQLDFGGTEEANQGQLGRSEQDCSASWSGESGSSISSRLSLSEYAAGGQLAGWAQISLPLSDDLSALWSTSPALRAGPSGGVTGGSWSNSLQLRFTSWDGLWGLDFSSDHSFDSQDPSAQTASGAAGCFLHWQSWSLQPQVRYQQIALGQPQTRSDFGFSVRLDNQFSWRAAPIKAGIYGVVFEDLNGNGVRDPGEPVVGLVDLLLDGETSVTADSQGRFAFDGLLPVLHHLEVDWDSVPPEFERLPHPIPTVDLSRRHLLQVDVPLRRKQNMALSGGEAGMGSDQGN
jgi:hypothetical protein